MVSPNHRNEVELAGARHGRQLFDAATVSNALAAAAFGRAVTAADNLRLASFATGYFTAEIKAASLTAAGTAIDTASTGLSWSDAESIGIWKEAARAAFQRALSEVARFPKPTGPVVGSA